MQLKGLLEDCIDFSKAKQNEYVINPNFEPALKAFTTELDEIRARMDALKDSVADDLGVSKKFELVESNTH